MDTIGIFIYCQGFILPKPYGYTVCEMGLCDLSGKHRAMFAYENSGPSYDKLSAETQTSVDEACKQHGVRYEPKYRVRSANCLTDDFDTFVAKFSSKPNVGVWAGDAVAQAFMAGMGVSTVVIEHANLQTLPFGSVMSDQELHKTERKHCSLHGLRKSPPNNDDEDDYMHRCSMEFACALAALVRKQTHYRPPTLVQDLLYQRNLWQHRMERLLDVLMCCSEFVADMSRAFDRGEGLSWYLDCDTSPCCFLKTIFQYGVHYPIDKYWNASDYHDSTLDTLPVLTPKEDD